MTRLHPAYLIIQAAERCWSDSDKQASERAMVVCSKLTEAGLLPEAAMRGGVCIVKEVAQNDSQIHT